jgi:chromosome segregation ATPase
MDSEQILHQFDVIQNRLKSLVFQLQKAEEKLKNAEEENVLLKSTLKTQELNLKNLQKNQGNEQKDFQKREFFAKLVQNTGGTSDDSSELKKALDDYIKEIESCIAKLSN